ncbi:MAG: hypothetical protein JXB03_04675 [Spirochaetales bacterium]|nr:hypothetical protein [Spirochaetales bacterium]
MDMDFWPEGIPRDGFLKVEREKRAVLDSTQKTVLIRKGNEFFNAGNILLAKRIFITTGYSDGLIRIGDHYLKHNEPVEALKMYALAPAPDKVREMSGKIASIIRNLLKS